MSETMKAWGISVAEACRRAEAGMSRFVMKWHAPVDVFEDGAHVVCMNHWGHPKPDWPCQDYVKAAERLAAVEETRA